MWMHKQGAGGKKHVEQCPGQQTNLIISGRAPSSCSAGLGVAARRDWWKSTAAETLVCLRALGRSSLQLAAPRDKRWDGRVAHRVVWLSGALCCSKVALMSIASSALINGKITKKKKRQKLR
jgi:hypothetical protein